MPEGLPVTLSVCSRPAAGFMVSVEEPTNL